MLCNCKGQTFVESLIVLSMVIMISALSLVHLKPHHTLLETQLFTHQFKADLLYAQQYAIAHQREVTVNIFPKDHYYYIRDRVRDGFIIERHYSSLIIVSEGSLGMYFQFLPDGNVNRFGTIFFKVNEELYKITVMIGKGRIVIVKQ